MSERVCFTLQHRFTDREMPLRQSPVNIRHHF